MLLKKSELRIKDFYCIFVCREIILIAFLGPLNCVYMYMQYAASSRTMYFSWGFLSIIFSSYKGCPQNAKTSSVSL